MKRSAILLIMALACTAVQPALAESGEKLEKKAVEITVENQPASQVDVKMADFSYNRYLIDALDDDNVGIRTSAALLLKKRLCRDAKEPLMEMLQHDEVYVARIIAGLALMDIGDEESVALIDKQAESDDNLTVRHVLLGVTQELNKRYMANK